MSRKSFSNLYFDSNVLFFLSISIVAICFSITFFSNTVLAESQQYIFIKKWGSRCDNQDNGSCIHKNEGQFSDPTGLAIDSPDNVYVIDYFNHRVEKFNEDGTFITQWGSFGTKQGQLDYATGIAVDKDGFVYVADTNNNRIQKFTSAGIFVSSCCGGSNPFGVAVYKDGFIYVTFPIENVVKKFTNNGHLDTQWGSPGTGNGQFSETFGVAVDKDGFVYVADSDINNKHPGNIDRIQKFTSAGIFVTKWGSPGTGDGQFQGFPELAVDKEGFVYATDFYNHRVQKFTSDGTFVTKWGSPGTGNGQFTNPWGIGINSKGNVYVSDFINNNVQVFALKTDNIFPDTQITSAIDGNGNSISDDGSTVSNKMTFTFTGSDNVDISSFECSIDGTPYTNCNSPITFNGLKAGTTHTFKVRAMDTTGNVDPTPATFSWTVLTPKQALQNLIDKIDGMRLPRGTTKSLEAILHADIRQLSRNSDVAACNILDAFLHQVNAYEGSRLITSQQAMDLIQQATAIQQALGCSPSISSSSPSSSSLSPDVTNGENMVIPFKASP